MHILYILRFKHVSYDLPTSPFTSILAHNYVILRKPFPVRVSHLPGFSLNQGSDRDLGEWHFQASAQLHLGR